MFADARGGMHTDILRLVLFSSTFHGGPRASSHTMSEIGEMAELKALTRLRSEPGRERLRTWIKCCDAMEPIDDVVVDVGNMISR